MVPSGSGIFREYREVTGTPRGVYGPYWALVERRGKEQGRGCPPKSNPNWEGDRPPFPSFFLLLPSLLEPTKGRGILHPVGVGLPLFLVGVGEEEGREERRKGGAAPLLVQFGLEGEGARGLPWPALLFSLMAHVGPLTPGGFR